MLAIRTVPVLAFGAILALPAAAAEPAPYLNPAPVSSSTWIVTVKGTVAAKPAFLGSDKLEVTGFPSLSFRRPGTPERFSSPDDGISVALFEAGAFRLGPVARLYSGRYVDDDRRLAGLRDVKWTVEPGLFAEFWLFEQIRLRGEVRHGINGHDGFVADLGADWVTRFDRFTFAVGPRLALGDQEYMRTNFGVTRPEAALNRRVAPYRPDGGLVSTGLASSLTYRWSEAWSTTLFGSYKHLLDEAGDSPIVKAFGTRHQFEVGLSLSYSFGVNW